MAASNGKLHFLGAARLIIDERIDPGHAMPQSQQLFAQSRPDESGRAGYYALHKLLGSPLKNEK